MKKLVYLFVLLCLGVFSAFAKPMGEKKEEAYSMENPVSIDVAIGSNDDKSVEIFLVNKTDYIMLYMYIKTSSDTDWGSDIFDGNIALKARHIAYINLKGIESGVFDFKAVDQHGSVYIIKNVKLPTENDEPVILDMFAFEPEESP
ncbi:hypothetical protein WKV44_00965 [Spirochaetia bacterium 38H-sp]|uniref:Uncharacterized protein n=1 Tax=Rarispira pelagica TaxID=3141764 RepID=A0ABU9U8W4_9SPIR